MKKGLTCSHEKLAAALVGPSFCTSSKALIVESTNPHLSSLSATDETHTKARPLMKADDGLHHACVQIFHDARKNRSPALPEFLVTTSLCLLLLRRSNSSNGVVTSWPVMPASAGIINFSHQFRNNSSDSIALASYSPISAEAIVQWPAIHPRRRRAAGQ